MNEIISVHGKPFHTAAPAAPLRRSRGARFSFRRVGSALLLILGSLTLLGAAGWGSYQSVFVKMRAESGQAEAQYQLGHRNLGLTASRQDRAEAVKWIQRAAEQGYAEAQTLLGVQYAKGIGSAQDAALAARWFRKAALQGNTLAQNELAGMYAGGRGVPRDLRKAAYWYACAAANGSPAAQANLALVQAAKSRALGDITTRTRIRYTNASLVAVRADGLMVAYDSGKAGVALAKVKREDLPENLQQLCKYASQTEVAHDAAAPRL
jgi:TPR repeat protein